MDIDFNNLNNDKKKYNEPYVVNDIDISIYFDNRDIELSNQRNKNLLITNKGIYSITKADDAEWITNCIRDFVKNYVKIDKTNDEILYSFNIIDATACIGGNTLNFCKYFFNVISIELNKVHYDILNNNINACGYNNIKTYNANFLDFINSNNIESDMIFIDPPWGGFQYKIHKYFNLKLGTIPIEDIIGKLLLKYKYVILKAPINLNLNILKDNIDFYKVNIYKNSKNNLLLLIFTNNN